MSFISVKGNDVYLAKIFIDMNVTTCCIYLLLLISMACSEVVDCSRETKTEARVSFVKKIDGKPLGIAFDAITAAGTGVIFYTSVDSTNVFDLPLDPRFKQTTYLFIKDNIVDTLSLGYENQFVIIDEDCEPEISFNNLEILHASFDSLKLVDKRLLIGIENNIKIYL